MKRFFQSPWLWAAVFGLIASSAFAESNWGIVTRAYAVLSGATFTGPVIVPAGSASAPGLAISDANDGLFESADGTIGITLAGTQQWEITGSTLGGLNAAGPDVRNIGASGTVPTLLPRSNTGSGIGAVDGNSVDLIGASVSGLRVTSGVVERFALPPGENVGATCTAGELLFDTTGADEVCFCTATDTLLCLLGTAGPTD